MLTDSLSALVASPPLLYVTNARRFTDWRLVFTAVTFQVSSAVVCLPMFTKSLPSILTTLCLRAEQHSLSVCKSHSVSTSLAIVYASACLMQQQLHTYGLPVHPQAASAHIYVIPVKGTRQADACTTPADQQCRVLAGRGVPYRCISAASSGLSTSAAVNCWHTNTSLPQHGCDTSSVQAVLEESQRQNSLA